MSDDQGVTCCWKKTNSMTTELEMADVDGYGVPPHKCTICKLQQQKQHEHEETDSASVIAATQASQTAFLKHTIKAGKYYYGVSIMNGKQLGAGTADPEAYICIVGSNGHSGKLYLQSLLSMRSLTGQTLHRGTWDNLIIESSGDLGEIQVVILGIDKSALLGASWYVHEVGVYNFQSKTQEAFPCCFWIGNGESVSFTSKTTTVRDVSDNDVLLTQRRKQLEKRKLQYGWKKLPDTGLPSCMDDTSGPLGFINTLPREEKFDIVKSFDFTATALDEGAKILLQSISIEMKHLHDYEKMATVLGNPEVSVHDAARWTTDVEFGRQMLNGVNPVVIKKCKKLPTANFPVTNKMVKSFLNRGKTLDEEIEAGHVYICDLKIMEGLPTRKGQYCAAPICLLYVNGSNELVPIAIQLRQEARKDEENPIFLPSDHLIDWLLAKIYYQSAHSQFHQLSTHYFSCHAAMEAYAVATMRNLPDPHPIYKLLRPHFRYTMAINTRARATLINDGGIIDKLFAIGGEGKVELFKRVSAQYSVHWTNIVQNAKERGVDNPDQLPGYYYRDDGIKVWGAIEEFVRGIIDIFYETDDDVKEDPELKSWAEDVHTNAFPGYFGAKEGHDFPEKISTKKDLTEYCTLIMFTGSAQHASINFGQYDMYGFIPNASSALRLPLPTKKGQADYTTLLSTLPNKVDTAHQVAVVNLLSQYSEDEIYLGNYPSGTFNDKTAHRLIIRFQEHLNDITGDIHQRNKHLDVPYTYMLPTKIPNSITI